ncbi:hypothetical protein [Kutzneria kofuensis]|uniref:Uncharacterized protein n=1 Tax=Kutzneria kofuensis TaxID=103725 RepID=A0A7W9KIQ0_9PSEU|nr:hypothetical protein [Kutzneria kofuensis]MBB5893338.1 hypothetical protein [Kutzneria kofuensis]
MERPAGGRRHSRGGSVSVADLIRRQPGSVRIPTPEEAATDALLGDLLGGKGLPDDSDPRTSTALKLLGVLVGAITLAGTIAAASMITGEPRPARVAVMTSPQPQALTGADALRPDVLATEVAGKTDPASPLGAASTTTGPSPTAVTPTVNAGPSQRALTQNAAASPVDVVRDFYNTVAQNPRDALAMMGDSLADLDPTGFIRSWSSVRVVRPERVEAMSDGTVLGVIGIQQADGSWLHVEQLLRVDGGNQPKIIGAQVLSAQQG